MCSIGLCDSSSSREKNMNDDMQTALVDTSSSSSYLSAAAASKQFLVGEVFTVFCHGSEKIFVLAHGKK